MGLVIWETGWSPINMGLISVWFWWNRASLFAGASLLLSICLCIWWTTQAQRGLKATVIARRNIIGLQAEMTCVELAWSPHLFFSVGVWWNISTAVLTKPLAIFKLIVSMTVARAYRNQAMNKRKPIHWPKWFYYSHPCPFLIWVIIWVYGTWCPLG